MTEQHPSFAERVRDDYAWFQANPDRSFRLQVLGNAAAAHYFATRDGFGSAVFPVGEAIMLTYWRFDSPTTKAMDTAVVPSAPTELIEAVVKTDDHDAVAMEILLSNPTTIALLLSGSIVMRGPQKLVELQQAA